MIIVPVYCIFFKCQALLFRQRAFFAHFNNKLIMLDQPEHRSLFPLWKIHNGFYKFLFFLIHFFFPPF